MPGDSCHLVGSGIGVGIVAPEHVFAQLGTHSLHLVLGQLGPLGVEEGAAVLVLGNPVCKMRLEKIQRNKSFIIDKQILLKYNKFVR